jgi:hypothetical protein
MDEGIGPVRWQDDLYDLLRRNNVTQFAYVPDAGHRILIDRSLADPEVHSVVLTSEEEGVAMLAGADLGGARGVLLMQSSGTGNCVNISDQGRPVSVSDVGQHAGRFRRRQSVAVPDGAGGAAGARGFSDRQWSRRH